MMDWEKVALNFGLPGIMLVALYLVVTKLGGKWIDSHRQVELERIKVEDKKADAMSTALISLGGKIDAHHTADIQSHQDLSTRLARVDAKLDTIAEFTPVQSPIPQPQRRSTPVGGVPSGEYGYSRPKTHGGR